MVTTSHIVSGTRGGTVEVSLEVARAAAEMWSMLTQPREVAQWFGTLSGPLETGVSVRVDFGDGDFFTIDDVLARPPDSLRYVWRFMGTGPRDTVTWTLATAAQGTRVTVTDDEPGRSESAARDLQSGWLDFIERLDRFARTGETSRYDWRREFDASIELAASPAQVWGLLFGPGALERWLPPGTIAKLTQSPPRAVTFELSLPEWATATQCALSLAEHDGGSRLIVSHRGWEQISGNSTTQRAARERFSHAWMTALGRAQRLASAPGATTDV